MLIDVVLFMKRLALSIGTVEYLRDGCCHHGIKRARARDRWRYV